jgi:diguanylate cyclase (GGDEF)-like protein
MAMTQKPRVLIVDDEAANVHVLARALNGLYDLFFATKGEQAIEIAAKQQVDLVLLDVVMPGLDGLEVLRRLKSDELLAVVPVIFVTAMSDVDDEARGFALGAVDYIAKPISPSIVRARVATHLELKRQRDLLEQRAFLDGLTGIANRRRLDERLDAIVRTEARRKLPVSFALIDVDHFKLFNDTYGHAVGDECLRHVAAVLSEVAGRPDDLASRFGGEEFTLLLPDTGFDGLKKVVSDLLAGIRGLGIGHETSPTAELVTVSVGGLAVVPDVGQDAVELVKSADELLYEAKEGGRDNAVLLDAAGGAREVLRLAE